MNNPVIDNDGTKRWYHDGLLHRDDGPAVEYKDGEKSWYQNGTLHREDGPALEWNNGLKRWYWNGVGYTRDEFILLQFTNNKQ